MSLEDDVFTTKNSTNEVTFPVISVASYEPAYFSVVVEVDGVLERKIHELQVPSMFLPTETVKIYPQGALSQLVRWCRLYRCR
jgi:hypothetical protein